MSELVKVNVDFDKNNPTNENIDYCFKKLIYNLEASLIYNKDFKIKKYYEDMISLVRNWLNIYITKKSLISINHKELLDMYERLPKIIVDSYGIWHVEEVQSWLWDFMCLRKAQIDNYEKNNK